MLPLLVANGAGAASTLVARGRAINAPQVPSVRARLPGYLFALHDQEEPGPRCSRGSAKTGLASDVPRRVKFTFNRWVRAQGRASHLTPTASPEPINSFGVRRAESSPEPLAEETNGNPTFAGSTLPTFEPRGSISGST
jgi:hypothetical protein